MIYKTRNIREGTGDRKQEPGNIDETGTGDRKQEKGSRKEGTGDWQHKTAN